MGQKKETPAQKELAEKVAVFFGENPKTEKVFASADGFLFENEKFAQDHASTIDVKEVETFLNPNLLEVETEEVKDKD
jgi:hypothetical protein